MGSQKEREREALREKEDIAINLKNPKKENTENLENLEKENLEKENLKRENLKRDVLDKLSFYNLLVNNHNIFLHKKYYHNFIF